MRTKNSRRKDMKNKFKDFFIKNNLNSATL